MELFMWAICVGFVGLTAWLSKKNLEIPCVMAGLMGITLVCYTVKHF